MLLGDSVGRLVNVFVHLVKLSGDIFTHQTFEDEFNAGNFPKNFVKMRVRNADKLAIIDTIYGDLNPNPSVSLSQTIF